MNLINADQLINEGFVLTKHGTSNRVIERKSIADVPTAFNPDKVIKQIEANYRKVKKYEDTVFNLALDIAIGIIDSETKGTSNNNVCVYGDNKG